MSMTKNSPGYIRYMEELFAEREDSDCSYEEYQEWCHMNNADPLRSFGGFIEKLLSGGMRQERSAADDARIGEHDA